MFEHDYRFAEYETKYGEREDVLENYLCPISQTIMKDPVIVAETGQTYERSQIADWFKENNTDPLTKITLKSKALVENIALRNAIEEFMKSESKPRYFGQRRHFSCTSESHHGRNELEFNFKVSVIGPVDVGKTALIRKLCYGEWVESYKQTITLDIEFVVVKVGDGYVRLCFWDTAGEERFNSMMLNCVRGSDAVLTVFDLSKLETLNDAKCFFQNAPTADALLFLVGCKADKLNDEEMKTANAIGQLFADNNRMLFFGTSAKDETNIKKLLLKIARTLSAMSEWRNNKRSVIDMRSKTSNINLSKKGSSIKQKCCKS